MMTIGKARVKALRALRHPDVDDLTNDFLQFDRSARSLLVGEGRLSISSLSTGNRALFGGTEMNPSHMRIACHFCALSTGVFALTFSSWLLMAFAGVFAVLAVTWRN